MRVAVEDKYIFSSIEDNIREKDWAAGSSKQIESNEFIIRSTGSGYTGVYAPVTFPPALWKLTDEVIVNALDHHIRCLATTTPVTNIKVGLSDTGEISVTNDGPGIEIEIHKVASQRLGRDVWVPSLIFGVAFQGMNRKQADDSIIGGTNGLGSKLANCFSTKFTVETVSNGMYFSQTWTDHMKAFEPPVVAPVSDMAAKLPHERLLSHTTISFVPDYIDQFGYKSFDTTLYETMCDLIRTRAFFAAAYANYTVSTHNKHALSRQSLCPAINIQFNGERINARGITDIATMCFPGKDIYSCIVSPKTAHPWEVCAVITGANAYDPPSIGIVNGIIVKYGKHYTHIMNEIVLGVTDAMSKALKDKNLKFSRSQVENNIVLLLNTKIPKPSWTGQRKDMLHIDIRKLTGYTLEKTFISSITEKLRAQIMTSILGDIPVATGRKKQKQVLYEQYKPARRCGTKDSLRCSLIVCEGRSALSQTAIGIANTLGWDHYGAIALGGVIINVRRNCNVIETDTGRYVKKTTAKLANNEFMKVLTDVTGLNTAYKYEPKSVTYPKEMAELNYGALIACVDQDLDGKGFILGLLLSTFELFWPRLLNAGYIKWFCTPIVRAYPRAGGKIKEFYSIQSFEQWEGTMDVSRYEVRYYKGIASHGEDETKRMFSVFKNNLHTYYCDDRSRELFDIYFGNSPNLRKIELSRPIVDRSPDAAKLQDTEHRICCSEHLMYETFLFQKDNLHRKLNHIIDGQNQAGRKVIDGILHALSKPNKRIKVSQLAGHISQHEAYHHGEACLVDTIAGKAFITTGGKQLPFLLPMSQFGSRLYGTDAGQPRYIWTKLNKRLTDLIFPQEDYWILPFNYEEGKRAEPQYFVPIIPLVLSESTSIPAHGWNLVMWARNAFDIITNVRRLITLADDCQLITMRPCTYAGGPHEWKGSIRSIRGNPYSFGIYTYNSKANTIHITELPLRVWTDNYVNDMMKKANTDARIIANIHNASDNIRVDITVKLRPGAMDILNTLGDFVYTDGIQEYFQLRNHMYSNINIMGQSGEILSYTSYEAVMYGWFPVRKEYYGQRTDRVRIIKTLTIRKLENIIRYIEECNSFNFSKQKKATMESVLQDKHYDRIDTGKLTAPKYTPTNTLEQSILSGDGANYDYLLKISDLKKSEESLEAYRGALSAARDDLADYNMITSSGRFPGAVIWENELTALEAIIREGQQSAWKYGEESKYKFE